MGWAYKHHRFWRENAGQNASPGGVHEVEASGWPTDPTRRPVVAGLWVGYLVRLHSALGYITPKDKLEGNEQTIFQERDRKLEDARERRKLKRRIEGRQNRPDNGPEDSKKTSGHFVPNQLTYAQQYSNSG